MHPFAALATKIEQRVRESHGDILNALFAHIDGQISLMELAANKCSYEAALGIYAGLKISMHHLRRTLDDLWGRAASGYVERLQDCDHRARRIRDGLYTNVCLNCPACRSRRQAWPRGTKFQSGCPRKLWFDLEAAEGPILWDASSGKWEKVTGTKKKMRGSKDVLMPEHLSNTIDIDHVCYNHGAEKESIKGGEVYLPPLYGTRYIGANTLPPIDQLKAAGFIDRSFSLENIANYFTGK